MKEKKSERKKKKKKLLGNQYLINNQENAIDFVNILMFGIVGCGMV